MDFIKLQIRCRWIKNKENVKQSTKLQRVLKTQTSCPCVHRHSLGSWRRKARLGQNIQRNWHRWRRKSVQRRNFIGLREALWHTHIPRASRRIVWKNWSRWKRYDRLYRICNGYYGGTEPNNWPAIKISIWIIWHRQKWGLVAGWDQGSFMFRLIHSTRRSRPHHSRSGRKWWWWNIIRRVLQHDEANQQVKMLLLEP